MKVWIIIQNKKVSDRDIRNFVIRWYIITHVNFDISEGVCPYNVCLKHLCFTIQRCDQAKLSLSKENN